MTTYSNTVGTQHVQVQTGTGVESLRPMHMDSTAMTWGNDGDAAHDLALSILTDYFEFTRHKNHTDALAFAAWLRHQFTLDFVAGWHDGWSIDIDTIGAWVDQHPEQIEG